MNRSYGLKEKGIIHVVNFLKKLQQVLKRSVDMIGETCSNFKTTSLEITRDSSTRNLTVIRMYRMKHQIPRVQQSSGANFGQNQLLTTTKLNG